MSQIEKRKHTIILLNAKKHSVKEVSIIVGISVSTVYNLIDKLSDTCPIELKKGSGGPPKIVPLITNSVVQQIRRITYISLELLTISSRK